jgi:lipopolysaccharide biosynthesis protein
MNPSKSELKARLIAFYLPQFHPIPENDKWWGNGFTEWTNVAKAKPLFKGHYQPRLPADLGFYDLRIPEVREAQAEMARNAGIEGFCYYHYWFGGKRLLERPLNDVLASGKPELPFCLCWANQTWTGIWHGAPGRVLIEQTYPGEDDTRNHFLALRNAFLDKRYMRVNGRPIFVVFRPAEHPDIKRFIHQWQELAVQNGLPGLHFVAHLFHYEAAWDYKAHGFDACVIVSNLKSYSLSMRDLIQTHGTSDMLKVNALKEAWGHWIWRRYRALRGQFRSVLLYRHALKFLLKGCNQQPSVYPSVIPNWDNTPRSGTRGVLLHDSTPELFRQHLAEAINLVSSHEKDQRVVFIKSWNEWAEGNYLEPDQKHGHNYLTALKEEVFVQRKDSQEKK